MKTKRLTLVREKAEAERTFGALFVGTSFVGHTLEPGDADVDHPRVPPGFYRCEPHGWDPDTQLRFRRTWALVGAYVSHQPEPGIPRAAILFHRGVRDEHTLGCILLGESRGESMGEPALIDPDGKSMERLRQIVGNNSFDLVIVWGGWAWASSWSF